MTDIDTSRETVEKLAGEYDFGLIPSGDISATLRALLASVESAEAEMDRFRSVCWSLFHLGNDGSGLEDASWTGAKWIDSSELAEVWGQARAALAKKGSE